MKNLKSRKVWFKDGYDVIKTPILIIIAPLLGLVYIIIFPFVGVAVFILTSGYQVIQSLAKMRRKLILTKV